MNWLDTVHEKMNELELIASWASMTNLGRVRDACRNAQAELRHELERCEKMVADKIKPASSH